MKQKYLSILFSLIIFATLFFAGACNKEDSFDYGNYEPVLTNLTSDLSVTPMIGRTYSYKTVIRGGSTYQWTVSTGADVTNFDEEATGYVYVTDALVTGDFIVSVTETTAAGKVSEPFKDTVVVTAIFPFTCAGVSGDNEPIQTFDYEYSVNLYNSNDMKFSTYTWAVTGGTVTPDLEETYNAVINFTEPGLQTITVTETNSEGLVDVSETVVDVVPFCSLTDGLNDFVGTYTGVDDDDGWWYGSVSQDYTFAVAGDELEMGGMFY
ncbi:MAG: hypothetical protein JXR51_14200, partial [Bacteroidales bacterium]|nr:hypothetical protein [Bacteroidales bacterium]